MELLWENGMIGKKYIDAIIITPMNMQAALGECRYSSFEGVDSITMAGSIFS
jgi:hypothetical protein